MSYKVTRGNAAEPSRASNSGKSGFQTFEDLEVYRVAREFRKAMYAMTRWLPAFEKYESSSVRETDEAERELAGALEGSSL